MELSVIVKPSGKRMLTNMPERFTALDDHTVISKGDWVCLTLADDLRDIGGNVVSCDVDSLTLSTDRGTLSVDIDNEVYGTIDVIR